MRLAVLVTTMVAATVVAAAPARAFRYPSAVSTFPSSVAVGQTGVQAALFLENFSTPPDNVPMTFGPITLVPSCGDVSLTGDCAAANVDPGVFQLSATGTGAAGTQCAGISFPIAVVDPAQGKVRFFPPAPLVLNAGQTCRIDFTFSVVRAPNRDAGAAAGVQTAQLVRSTGTVNGITVASVNSALTTMRAAATVVHLVNVVPSDVGFTLTDSAAVSGANGRPAPTGTVTFRYFRDLAGATPCSGPPAVLGTVGLTPEPGGSPSSGAVSPALAASGPAIYRFVLSYSGDLEYAAVTTTPCGAPGSTVDVPAPSGRYTPLTPARILDTRTGSGGLAGALGPGQTVSVQVTGRGGVPSAGVAAVAVNVTATQPTADGFLTLFPAGQALPLAANLNFTPGKTVSNLVVVKVGTSGNVDMYNPAGSTHVIYDVAGWFSLNPAGSAGRYQALDPSRILDTRAGVGGPALRLGPGESRELLVSAIGGVPTGGAEAVAVNVAITNASAPGYLTLHPSGEARPLAANLNWVAGETVSNRVIAKLGANGRVTIFNPAGTVDVIVDVNGWFTNGSTVTAVGAYTALAPSRIVDTRTGAGGLAGPLGAGTTVEVQITGRGGVPATGVSAVILNATVVDPTTVGYLTMFPAGTARPLASDLNYAAGEVRANLVVVKVGAGGRVSLYTTAADHIVFDVAGYLS